jgi:hypothetical protein
LLKYPKMVKYPDVSVLFIRSLENNGSDSEVPLILVKIIINKLIWYYINLSVIIDITYGIKLV